MNVALNISNKNIKILSITGRKVKKWAVADLPPGLVRDGLILDPKKVGEAVSALFKQTGIPRDKVTAGVTGLSFTYRFINLPHMNSGQLEEAILRGARKEISIPLDNLYISWQRLPDIGNELSFFVLGIERKRIDALVDTFKAAGIPPYLAGLRPLALARIAERSDAIIVSIDESCFDIVVISGGIPRVIHTINPRETSVTLEDNIHRLADELTKTATFYQSNNPEFQLDKNTPLLLTGDWAAEPAASALLQTEVDYPISRLMAQVQIPKGFPVESFTALVGLALKKSPPKTATKIEAANFIDININILSGKYRKPKAKPVKLTSILAWVLLVAVILLLYPLYQARAIVTSQNTALSVETADIQRQINIITSINADNNVTENKIKVLTDAAGNIKTAYQNTLTGRGAYSADLDLITSLIPAQTIFSSVQISGSDVFINGESNSTFTVIGYAAALQKQGVFKTVRINNMAEAASSFSSEVTDNVTVPVNIIQFTIVVTKLAPGNPY